MFGSSKEFFIHRGRVLFLYTLRNFLIFIVFLGTIFFAYEANDLRIKKETLQTAQANQLELLQSDIDLQLEEAAVDILFLKNIQSLNEYISDQSSMNAYRLHLDFLHFLGQKEKYDHIRLLDLSGMEVVRVNFNHGNPVIVRPDELQDKSGRDYYQDLLTLHPNEVLFSNFDLNVENGEVEDPPKPILRLMTPVMGHDGEIVGYLLLNFLGQSILDEIAAYDASNPSLHYMLLNPMGYWLYHPDRQYEFAFVDGKTDENIRITNPSLSARIFDEENERFSNSDYHYSFTTIHINQLLNHPHDYITDRSWKLGVYFDESLFTMTGWVSQSENQVVLVLFLVILLLLSTMFGYMRYQRRLYELRADFAMNIIDNTKEAVLITDEKTNIVYANDSYYAITGFSADEVIGKRPSDFKSGKHDVDFYREMWQSIQNTGWWMGEIWDIKKGNGFYLKHLSIRKIETKRNEIFYIGYFDDVSSVREIDERYERLRTTDSDTNLPNEIKIQEDMDHFLQTRHPFSLLVIKLKNYVDLVNTLGNEQVKLLMQKVSAPLLTFARKEEGNLYRIDRDKLAILAMTDIREKQSRWFNELYGIFSNPIIEKDLLANFSTGFGFTTVEEFSNDSAFYLQNADIAAYKAAQGTEEEFVEFSEELREYYSRNLKIRMHLQSALDNDEFMLFFQPQVRLRDGKMVGVEALIRWDSEELGFVSPGEFIKIAEENDMIIPIGEWVIEQVCKQKRQWNDAGFNDFTVAINTSPNHFIKADLYEELDATMKKYGISGEEIEIEVTEEMLIKDHALIVQQLKRIRALGIRVALDDFGTGYSSLQYLRNLPVDTIKIDRSFIKDIPKNDDGTIAAVAVDLAKRLNLTTIAEGVESDQQLDFIHQAGGDIIQGYYFSKPLNADDFIRWYEQHNKVETILS